MKNGCKNVHFFLLYTYGTSLESLDIESRNCTVPEVKTNALTHFAVTVKLVSVVLFLHMQNVGFLMCRQTAKLISTLHLATRIYTVTSISKTSEST